MSPSSWFKSFMSGYGVDVSGGYNPANLPPGPPMDLANMRQNGVRSLAVLCLANGCGHATSMNVDQYPGHLAVKSFEGRMKCSRCSGKNVEVRPDWSTLPPYRPSPAPIRG